MVGACGWDTFNSNASNSQILYGALVGGPGIFEQYEDKRANYTYNSVGLDYNAGLQGLVAGNFHKKIL